MNNEFDLIIGGYGIGARCLLRELALSGEFSNKKILVLRNEDWFSPCSLNTTSVVCLSGVQKNISPLGDLIFDSYELARDYLEANPRTFEKGVQYNLTDQSEAGADDFIRRFGDLNVIESFNKLSLSTPLDGMIFEAYFVRPNILLETLENSYINELEITFINEPILSFDIEINEVKTQSNSYTYSKLFLALGAHFEHFKRELGECLELQKSKVVSGSYLIYENVDWGDKGFSIARKHSNLVYRSFEKTLMVGGSTVKEDIQSQSFIELQEQLEDFRNLLPSDFSLPEFSDFKIRTGLRHKGRKRTPYFGALKENSSVYLMSGLYKNGFSFPFYGAKKIAKDLI